MRLIGIALPFVVLMVELYYLLRGEKPGRPSLLINLLTALALLSSVLTGYVAHESIESIPIGDEAMEILHTHQTVGFALVALSLFALPVRIGYSLKEWVALKVVWDGL